MAKKYNFVDPNDDMGTSAPPVDYLKKMKRRTRVQGKKTKNNPIK